jgi:ABC-type proline/glycine betaine transport system permease subunit
MVSSERLLRAAVLAGVPMAVAVAFSPPDFYARLIVGLGTFLGTLPSAYLVVQALTDG